MQLWYRWYPARFAEEVKHLSPLGELAVRRLIDRNMLGESIPDDDAKIIRILRYTTEQYLAVEKEIRHFFVVFEGKRIAKYVGQIARQKQKKR